MKQLFKLQFGILFLIFMGACVPDTELLELPNAGQQEIIPLAKNFFEAEKPNQTSIHARLHQNLEVYPKWEDAKT